MKKPYQIEAQRAVVTRRNNLPLRVKFLSGWFLNFFPAFFRGIGYFPA
jgi:hypothetical protein